MSIRHSVLHALLSSPEPTVAIDVASDHVAIVQLDWTKHGLMLTAHARAELPCGTVTPGVNDPNIPNPKALTNAFRSVFDQLPRQPVRVAMTVPDNSAKVSLVRFKSVPDRTADLTQLIRWQVRKSAPFRLEDAQVSYIRGERSNASQQFIVALMRRDVVEAYEQACQTAGAHAGLIDLASFNLINLAMSCSVPNIEADWLFVHVAKEHCTFAIVRDKNLIFFRNRPIEDENNLPDLLHQTIMYYHDRLGGTRFTRAFLAGGVYFDGAGRRCDTLRRDLEVRLGVEVETIGLTIPTPVVKSTGGDASLLDSLAAPIGILLRNRVVTHNYA